MYVSRFHHKDFEAVVTEKLKPSRIIKNRHLAKSISDASWGVFFIGATGLRSSMEKCRILSSMNREISYCNGLVGVNALIPRLQSGVLDNF